MGKNLCKLIEKKILKDDPGVYMDLVSQPRFLCLKCGRLANRKKFLCEPKNFKN